MLVQVGGPQAKKLQRQKERDFRRKLDKSIEAETNFMVMYTKEQNSKFIVDDFIEEQQLQEKNKKQKIQSLIEEQREMQRKQAALLRQKTDARMKKNMMKSRGGDTHNTQNTSEGISPSSKQQFQHLNNSLDQNSLFNQGNNNFLNVSGNQGAPGLQSNHLDVNNSRNLGSPITASQQFHENMSLPNSRQHTAQQIGSRQSRGAGDSGAQGGPQKFSFTNLHDQRQDNHIGAEKLLHHQNSADNQPHGMTHNQYSSHNNSKDDYGTEAGINQDSSSPNTSQIRNKTAATNVRGNKLFTQRISNCGGNFMGYQAPSVTNSETTATSNNFTGLRNQSLQKQFQQNDSRAAQLKDLQKKLLSYNHHTSENSSKQDCSDQNQNDLSFTPMNIQQQKSKSKQNQLVSGMVPTGAIQVTDQNQQQVNFGSENNNKMNQDLKVENFTGILNQNESLTYQQQDSINSKQDDHHPNGPGGIMTQRQNKINIVENGKKSQKIDYDSDREIRNHVIQKLIQRKQKLQTEQIQQKQEEMYNPDEGFFERQQWKTRNLFTGSTSKERRSASKRQKGNNNDGQGLNKYSISAIKVDCEDMDEQYDLNHMALTPNLNANPENLSKYVHIDQAKNTSALRSSSVNPSNKKSEYPRIGSPRSRLSRSPSNISVGSNNNSKKLNSSVLGSHSIKQVPIKSFEILFKFLESKKQKYLDKKTAIDEKQEERKKKYMMKQLKSMGIGKNMLNMFRNNVDQKKNLMNSFQQQNNQFDLIFGRKELDPQQLQQLQNFSQSKDKQNARANFGSTSGALGTSLGPLDKSSFLGGKKGSQYKSSKNRLLLSNVQSPTNGLMTSTNTSQKFFSGQSSTIKPGTTNPQTQSRQHNKAGSLNRYQPKTKKSNLSVLSSLNQTNQSINNKSIISSQNQGNDPNNNNSNTQFTREQLQIMKDIYDENEVKKNCDKMIQLFDMCLNDPDIAFTFDKFQKILNCIQKSKEIIKKRVQGGHTYEKKRQELSELWQDAKDESLEFMEKFKPSYQTTQQKKDLKISSYMKDCDFFQVPYITLLCDGQFQFELRDFYQAKRLFTECKAFCQLKERMHEKMICYEQIGICSRIIGDHSEAIKYFKKLLGLAWEQKNEKFETLACDNLAIEYYYTGDQKKSQYYSDRTSRGKIETDESVIKKVAINQIQTKRHAPRYDYYLDQDQLQDHLAKKQDKKNKDYTTTDDNFGFSNTFRLLTNFKNPLLRENVEEERRRELEHQELIKEQRKLKGRRPPGFVSEELKHLNRKPKYEYLKQQEHKVKVIQKRVPNGFCNGQEKNLRNLHTMNLKEYIRQDLKDFAELHQKGGVPLNGETMYQNIIRNAQQNRDQRHGNSGASGVKKSDLASIAHLSQLRTTPITVIIFPVIQESLERSLNELKSILKKIIIEIIRKIGLGFDYEEYVFSI